MNFWNIPPGRAPLLIDAASGRGLTGDELREAIARLADLLRSAAPGGRKELAFLLMDNSCDSVVAYLALLEAGVAAALVPPHGAVELLAAQVDAYRPEWLIGTGGPPSDPRLADHYDYSLHRPGAWIGRRRDEAWQPIHPRVDLLLGTSGSTGSPQMVRLSKENLQANAASIAEYLGLDDRQRPITSLPLHYSYGLSVINSHLLVGAAIVCTAEGLMSKAFWNAFRTHHCTSMAGVPYMYAMLRRLRWERMELPSLSVLTQAGGHLDRPTKEYVLAECLRRGRRFFVMYGQTEATARISYVPPERLPDKLDSIGIPIPLGEMRLFDGDREITATGEAGEIVYRGPNVMLGYAERRDCLSRGDDLQGVLRTGDLAVRDAEGYFSIVGRKKRFIKAFGHRINLDELERLIERNMPVRAACLGRDNRLWVGYTAADEGSPPPVAAEMRDYLCRTLQLHPEAICVRQVGTIPHTSSGKKDYPSMEAEWLPPSGLEAE